MNIALDGLKVLDLTRLLPGAFCTQLFADFGADVLKIEQPGSGDYNRQFAPLAVEFHDARDKGRIAVFRLDSARDFLRVGAE